MDSNECAKAQGCARPCGSAACPLQPHTKRFATAQAHAMWFHGIRLEELEDDDGGTQYVASLHALTRRFRSLAEVEGWLMALDDEGAPRGEVARFLAEVTP